MKKLILFSSIVLLSGCSSLRQSVVLGSGVGAAGGILAGKSADFNTRGMVFMTGVGIVVGAGLAYLAHENLFSTGEGKALSSPQDTMAESYEVHLFCVDKREEKEGLFESRCTDLSSSR